MNLVRFVLFGWMFYLISALGTDESISFSPIELESKSSLVSYWYGNITLSRETSLLGETINIRLYLNQRQGLLFYTIDSKYRTLWVEFTKDFLEIHYYNFLISDNERRIYKLDKCHKMPDNNIDLTFSLRASGLLLQCNGNSQSIDYVNPPNRISEKDMISMTNTMVLPIPDFSNVNETQDNVVHMWIGNTPSVNDGRYKNRIKLKSNPLNLHGCVMFINIKGVILNLATSGVHHGEMLTSFCKPVCSQKSCLNNAQCTETWRGRFKCDCGFSKYVGKFCNESYSLQFDRSMSIHLETYFKLQTITFAFQPIIYGQSSGLKLLSLRFLNNQFLHVFISNDNYPVARFLTESQSTAKLGKLDMKIKTGHNYTVSIDVTADVISFKVSWLGKLGLSDSYQTAIQTLQDNLIVNNILIGDSHAKTMTRISKFHGCIANFFWESGNRKFLWNEMKNFSSYQKCGEPKMPTTTILSRELIKNSEDTEISLSTHKGRGKVSSKKNIEINYSHMTYIAIAIAILIIGFLISIIIVYKCRENHNKKENAFVNSDKEKLQLSHIYKPIDNIDAPYAMTLATLPSFPKTSFKPAYKARSMSSSTNGRSMLSLPLSVTPTLVTPEGEVL